MFKMRIFNGLFSRNRRQPLVGKPIKDISHDPDGIPPGVDLDLLGASGTIIFTGEFFAMPGMGPITLKRPVKIIFACPEILVGIDLMSHTPYVIDRARNLSLGCRMTAHFHQGMEAKATPIPQPQDELAEFAAHGT